MTVSADDERFTETQTKPTVKRNRRSVGRPCPHTISRRPASGEHDLPALKFETFLREQAPAVFDADRIDCARELLERKRAGEGDAVIGDAVGREFAHPPKAIDPAVHARDGPDTERLNGFIDEIIKSRPVARATYQPLSFGASGHKVKIRRETPGFC